MALLSGVAGGDVMVERLFLCYQRDGDFETPAISFSVVSCHCLVVFRETPKAVGHLYLASLPDEDNVSTHSARICKSVVDRPCDVMC